MNKLLKIGFSVFFLLCCVLSSACASKITQDNFNKISGGMTMEQVKQILGEPTSSSSIGFGNLSGTTATWKGRTGEITIQFFNNKVQIKNFTSSSNSNWKSK